MVLLTDSICLQVLNEDKIIQGIGNEIHVHDLKQWKSIPIKLKHNGKVHGIDCNGNFILVFSENKFSIIKHSMNEYIFLCTNKITDWISSAKFIENEFLQICLVTFHSVAILIEFNKETKLCSIVKKISCKEKSTLYSSYISGNQFNDLTIFGGTAIGDIIIWKPLTIQNETSHSPVLHRFHGHNGVIFSIDFNIELGLLITTSDDRSVKIWLVNTNRTLEDSKNYEFHLHKTGFGHCARVFKGRIFQCGSKTIIATVGEDSFLCLWNTSGQLLRKRNHHFGATIWDVIFHQNTKTIYSVGSNGNMLAYSLEDALNQCTIKKIETDILNAEYIAKIKFFNINCLLGITNKNKLVLRTANGNWEILQEFKNFKCIVFEVYKNLIAIGGYKEVIFATFNGKYEILYQSEIVDNVIRSICFLSGKEFLICDEIGECKIITQNFHKISKINLPQFKEIWITSGCMVDKFLFLSNRQGNFYFYLEENNIFTLKSIIKHLHGYLGVTNMFIVKNQNDLIYIKTCGHENTLKIIKVNKKSCLMSVVQTQCVPITWIERMINIKDKQIVIGFTDNQFVLWEKTFGIIEKIPCGGGHRFWDFLVFKDLTKASFIYIKHRTLFYTEISLKMIHEIHSSISYFPWHISSCNILKYFPLENDLVLIVTGGEDNALKFFNLDLKLIEKLTFIDVMSLHISCIKCIKVEKENENNLYIFSAGGRAQICVTRFNLKTFQIEELSNFMLKSSDFDRKYLKNKQNIDFNPETRFISIDTFMLEDKNLKIILGCSDGYIRIFLYQNYQFKFINELFYNRCILHVNFLNIPENNNNLLITAATDGLLCFWDLNKFSVNPKPIFKFKHHSSGIHSIDLIYKNKVLLIITGGDDQIISLSKITFDNKIAIEFTKKLISMHSSQVVGVKFSICLKFIYSVGVDQKLYKISLLEQLKEINNYQTCIADAKGLIVIDNFCIVYGSGIQTIAL